MFHQNRQQKYLKPKHDISIRKIMANHNNTNTEEKLASLYGKSNIYKFKIDIFGKIKAFDFLEVKHQDNGGILCQVTNITRDRQILIGDCKVIGYRDSGVLKNIRTPFEHDAVIQIATDKFIEKTIDRNITKREKIVQNTTYKCGVPMT